MQIGMTARNYEVMMSEENYNKQSVFDITVPVGFVLTVKGFSLSFGIFPFCQSRFSAPKPVII